MTVADLIEQLRAMPQDAVVTVYYDMGNLAEVETVEIDSRGFRGLPAVVLE